MRFFHFFSHLNIYSQNNIYYQTEKIIPFLLVYHMLRNHPCLFLIYDYLSLQNVFP